MLKMLSIKMLPGFENKVACSIEAKLANLLFPEDAESLAGEGGGLAAAAVGLLVQGVVHLLVVVEDVPELLLGEVGEVEYVAELLAVEAVEPGVEGVELGAEEGTAFLVPFEGREGDAVLGYLRPFGGIPSMAAGCSFVLLPLSLDGFAEFLVRLAPNVVGKGLYIPGGIDELIKFGYYYHIKMIQMW